MSFLDRIPFLPKQQGKRELVFFFTLAGSIMLLGLIGGITGILYKDEEAPVTDGTPVTIEATATATEPAEFYIPGE